MQGTLHHFIARFGLWPQSPAKRRAWNRTCFSWHQVALGAACAFAWIEDWPRAGVMAGASTALLVLGLVLARRTVREQLPATNHDADASSVGRDRSRDADDVQRLSLRSKVIPGGIWNQQFVDVAQSIGADYVGIFGSVAAGTDDRHSDIDVLVIGDVGTLQAQIFFSRLNRTLRTNIQVMAARKEWIENEVDQGSVFWRTVYDSPRIDLAGRWELKDL
jgi:predicted nucleotidyltransferase